VKPIIVPLNADGFNLSERPSRPALTAKHRFLGARKLPLGNDMWE